MSVAETITLPGQPTDGLNIFVPLGGDGFIAPHSCYELEATLDGDASGGTNVIYINLDSRFQSLVSLISIHVSGAAANVAFEAQFATQHGKIPAKYWKINGDAEFSAVFSKAQAQWMPTPVFGSTRIAAAISNTGVGLNLKLAALVYNFDRRASETVPLTQLLASIPSAGQLIS